MELETYTSKGNIYNIEINFNTKEEAQKFVSMARLYREIVGSWAKINLQLLLHFQDKWYNQMMLQEFHSM